MPLPKRNSIGSFPSYLWEDECQIINALITSIFREGLVISVFDGEEYALKRSSVRSEIQKEVAATDETTFVVRDTEGRRHGFFWLIHGNRGDVLTDYTANEVCERICQRVLPTIEAVQEKLS